MSGARTLVVGVGVIGSYLAHALVLAENDVSVVARGAWGDVLRERGLVIHHRLQRTTTCDHPRVLPQVPEGEHFDVAFSVMRQDQQIAALPELARIDCDALVLVGNDLRAAEAVDYLAEHGRAGQVLLGFQSTAGVREGDRVECVRFGVAGLDVGPLAGEPPQDARALLGRVFTARYQPHWTRDMGDWLATHATAVLPMCFASYIAGCDRRQVTDGMCRRVAEAQAEGYALLTRAGVEILPDGDKTLFDGGPKQALWTGFLRLLTRTEIGTLCVDEHCRHAPDEMRALDESFEELRARAGGMPMPTWDGLALQMGGWDEVLARWGSGGR